MNHNHGRVLYTNCSTRPDQEVLRDALKSNFNINAQIRSITRKSVKIEYILMLPHQEAQLFLNNCDQKVLQEKLKSVAWKGKLT